jgi:hypothetical protein
MYTVCLRDAKTRTWQSIPDNREALSGRIQLYIYLTLFENLITREPRFDFDRLWRKLGLKPDAKLPTKFLVQAQLISNNENLELISLNDLVTSFYELLKDETIRVSPSLELVYYLRPSKSQKSKGAEQDVTRKEPLALLETVDARCERLPAIPIQVGTSRRPDEAQLERHIDGGVVPAKESRLSRSKQYICSYPWH